MARFNVRTSQRLCDSVARLRDAARRCEAQAFLASSRRTRSHLLVAARLWTEAGPPGAPAPGGC
jgi:uncharacterized damage-inducible protein DinB